MPQHNSDIWPPFLATLPQALEAAEGPTPPSDGMAPRRQPAVLLVDDDQFMLGMQSRMLRNMGYTMIGNASSADAALMLLGEGGQPWISSFAT